MFSLNLITTSYHIPLVSLSLSLNNGRFENYLDEILQLPHINYHFYSTLLIMVTEIFQL